MAVPTNVLQQVITYQKAELAWLLNSFYGISKSNKKFKNFNDMTANLGDTISFDVTPRFQTYNGLVITQQQSNQRIQNLVCSQAFNVSAGYTDQQFIFNVRDYMERFGEAAMMELGSKVEADILKNFVSGVRINDPQNANYQSLQTQSGPFRFYGDGVTPINTFGQLAQMVANFRDFGAAKNKMECVLPVANIPAIVNSGLNQFAMTRNNDLANSWELGRFANTDWFESNLLPTHVAGTVGNAAGAAQVLTVVSTNDSTGANVTEITFSTDASVGDDADAIKAGDLLVFNDGVSGQPNMRFLTFIGHEPTQQPVQFRATADAASSGNSVTVTLQTANSIGLVWAQNQNQNLNNAIAANMTVTVMPSHRAGCLQSGNQFYLAMPRLPDESPFDTVNTQDPDSGAAIRHYWGAQFGQNNRAYVRDAIFGSTLVPENSMRLLFPL
jgi:hypothetical protein